MTKGLTVLSLLLSTQAFAFDYNCFSTDDNEPYGVNRIQLRTTAKKVAMRLEGFDKIETYNVSDYTPARIVPKRPMIKLSLVGTGNNSYGESALYEFLGEKELMTGGYQLRDGKMGGFIKTTGHGYSWANYLCVRQ